jgi:hypothetical protein
MLYCQIGRAQSLGEICDGLNSLQGKKSHLGIETPRKSTWPTRMDIDSGVVRSGLPRSGGRVQNELGPKHRFRFKNKLLSIDTTTIDLCASMFDWALFMRTKGRSSCTRCLITQGFCPCSVPLPRARPPTSSWPDAEPSGGNDSGLRSRLRRLSLVPEPDRAEDLFRDRLRRCDPVQLIESRDVPKTVVSDETILVGTRRWNGFGPITLRRVTVLDDDGIPFQIVTNNFKLAASTIARIYQERWQIEVFFKAIKQNLRVKTFVGTSARHCTPRSGRRSSPSSFSSTFTKGQDRLVSVALGGADPPSPVHLPDLMLWLDDPFAEFARAPADPQLTLQFG